MTSENRESVRPGGIAYLRPSEKDLVRAQRNLPWSPVVCDKL